MNDNMGVVILAAGLGKRFGKNKMLQKIGNDYIIDLVVQKMKMITSAQIILIIGAYKKMKFILSKWKDIKILVNNNYDKGLSSSVSLGVNYCKNKFKFCWLMLGDKPFVYVKTLKKIYKMAKKNSDYVIRPFYNGIPGHPVVVPQGYYHYLQKFTGHAGARKIFGKEKNMKIKRINVYDKGIITDIDTIRDIQRKSVERGKL